VKETRVSARRYDIIIIGSGQGGVPLAKAMVQAGRRTALIERARIGGTCVNEGCTPTKTMVASARVAYLARRGGDYGVRTGPVTVDLARVRERKRDIVESFSSGSERKLRELGVHIIEGDARFVDRHRLAVRMNDGDERTLESDAIVINAGARPDRPSIENLDAVPTLDSTSIMELDTVPEHLLVLGGGYVGLEFGQMFRRFGSEVTVIQRGPTLLGREDADIANAVADIMREDGLTLLLESDAVRADSADGAIRLTVRTPDGDATVAGSHLLLATGRVPNTDTLGLDAAGIECDARGFIRVDDHLRTNVEGVYAIGDIKGGPAFTHISYDDFRVLRTNLLDGGDATIAGRFVPYTVFIDPQLGRIGLGEDEAKREGRKVRVKTMPMAHVARAIEMDEKRGLLKAIIDPDTGKLLGAAVLGVEGGELMSALQIAMMGGLRYADLRDAIFAHPTLAEGFNNLFND
jgi:pyruvate/2-oxoglutarate dehydrogenase complex dihydrolipoamide dehydrogenase (E3) component